MKHKTQDYKITAVKYYLQNDDSLDEVCKIFDCKKTSLRRWIIKYKKIIRTILIMLIIKKNYQNIPENYQQDIENLNYIKQHKNILYINIR